MMGTLKIMLKDLVPGKHALQALLAAGVILLVTLAVLAIYAGIAHLVSRFFGLRSDGVLFALVFGPIVIFFLCDWIKSARNRAKQESE